MQMGYNSDVRHNDVIVHIQTEDQGVNAAKIETQVFFSGTILDSRVISYSELVESTDSEEELANEVQRRMKALHKYFHNQIRRGAYDHRLPFEGETISEAAKAKAEEPLDAPPPPPAAAPAERKPRATIPPSQSDRIAAYQGIEDPATGELGAALLKAIA